MQLHRKDSEINDLFIFKKRIIYLEEATRVYKKLLAPLLLLSVKQPRRMAIQQNIVFIKNYQEFNSVNRVSVIKSNDKTKLSKEKF